MAEANQGVEVKNKTSRILIMIIIGLLLVIAGGVAAFVFWRGELLGLADETASQAQSEVVRQTGSPDKELYYYDIDQPLRVNFPKGSSASLIEIKVAFLLAHGDTLDAMKKHEPMIINSLLMEISAAGADKLKTVEGKNQLRARMLEKTGKIIEKMTGTNDVKDVFYTTFVMQ